MEKTCECRVLYMCANGSKLVNVTADVVETGKELVVACNKYKKLIVQGQPISAESNQETLLKFDSEDKKSLASNYKEDPVSSGTKVNSSIDVLCDIFTNSIPDGGDVLQPVSVLKYGM